MLLRIFPIALLLLTGCIQGEANTPPPNDYRFIELSKGNDAVVTDEGRLAVYPNVVEYRLKGSLVVRKRELAIDNTDYSKDFTEGLGYFVFDTSTGELQQGQDIWCAWSASGAVKAKVADRGGHGYSARMSKPDSPF